ncbi:transposable element Tcb2 transposase [Trichonephila clavipes]|uniref:Transposable element Tcb2 transposase n=1 Tax=Trichonephila clavipes TaxID=2585209 RepID=A0A8X7BA40_TRICX|nr:transposable element Tcb2 transposase [Trichonephila clavipes]
MAWPAYSPDLNPIETFWDALGRAVSSCFPPPVTLIELETVLQEEWWLFNSAVVDHLIESMVRRLAARVQRNSSIIMRVSKQWTDEGRTARKSGSGPRNVTSAREDRRLVRMAQTDRTAFSRQLAAQWSTATRVSLCASSIRRRLLQRGLRARIPLTQKHRRLRLHWANAHRSWRADWQQVVFSDKSRFNLWHHDGRIRVRLYAGERRIPECIIERHSGRTPGVMVWGAIAYHG